MKISSLNAPRAAVLAFALGAAQATLAQVPVAGTGTGVNVAFIKLFGSITAFTAKVDTQSIDAYQQEIVRMPMDLAARDNNVRLDIDLANVQSKDFSAATLATLKQSGLDRMVSLFRPDKKLIYIIYPGIQSYQEVALSKGEAEAFEKGVKLEKTALGKESVDGHPCVKNRCTARSGKESVLEAITWNASDLKDFPLKIEMKGKGSTVKMHFSQVRFVKPDAKAFEVPAGYGRMK